MVIGGLHLINGKYIEHTTVQGDTFDLIAFYYYNNEFMSQIIIKANPEYADILKFDSGVKLIIPIITKQVAATLPPWRQ
jgi:phage tail protein X